MKRIRKLMFVQMLAGSAAIIAVHTTVVTLVPLPVADHYAAGMTLQLLVIFIVAAVMGRPSLDRREG